MKNKILFATLFVALCGAVYGATVIDADGTWETSPGIDKRVVVRKLITPSTSYIKANAEKEKAKLISLRYSIRPFVAPLSTGKEIIPAPIGYVYDVTPEEKAEIEARGFYVTEDEGQIK